MNPKRYSLLVPLVALWTVFSPVVLAQKTYSVDVEVVNIFATVRDRKGVLVNDLDKDDFVVEEEGRRQEIRYFSRETDRPLTIGLLVDTSMSQVQVLEEEQKASLQFLSQVLRPSDDLAFLIRFDVDVMLLQDLTGSRELLRDSLQDLQVPSARMGSENGSRSGSRTTIGTVLFDSVFLAADEILEDHAGRKAAVVLSDGVDFGSVVTPEKAIESAHRADCIIYSVLYESSQGYGRRPSRWGRRRRPGPAIFDGKKALKELSEETGGKFFEVSKKQTLEKIFDQIQQELRSQYSIGYSPDANRTGTEFRKIQVKTKDKKSRVQCRSGYYPNP